MENDEKLSYQDVQDILANTEVSSCKVETSGQIVYYTGIYKWKDGTFHTTPEVSAFDADKHPSKL